MKLLREAKPRDWNVADYLAQQQARVETRIGELPLSSGKETKALAAFQYALSTPGKRFRPLLTIATADIYLSGHNDLVVDCGVAVECIHTASLIFDDLPCMDDAALRRGRSTTHRVHGEDQALLAAMSLVAQANSLLSRSFKARKGEIQKKLECLSLLSEAYSLTGLCGGQSDDLLNKPQLTMAELEYIHAKKTGALFVAAVEMGAVLGDANANERQWLRTFAKSLGLAFQIQDDLLDSRSSDETGKDSGKDVDKTTFITLLGEDACRELYNELIETAVKNLEPFGRAAFHLRALTRVIQKRKL